MPAFPVACLLLVVLAACSGLPSSGQVQTRSAKEQPQRSDASFDYNPGGPRKGASPVAVVGGFLQAMQATPVTSAVARKFLTDDANAGWVPGRSTVIYANQTASSAGSTVVLDLSGTAQLSERGTWLGNQTAGADLRYRLRLVRQQGQWRISNPPDAMILPKSDFETRFDQYSLYFFDKSAQVLVPEPVYLPSGEQAATFLVRGLLLGPGPRLSEVVQSFLPAGTQLDLSVPVSGTGVAEVPLSQEMLGLGDARRERALAQLAWTLRQVAGIASMRVTVDGSPLDLPGRGTQLDVLSWGEFDPAVNWASQELFGIRNGRVVSVSGDRERRIDGVLGARPFGLRSIAVDLPGRQVAGVTRDGGRVLVASRDAGSAQNRSEPSVLYSAGADLLPPSWDVFRQAWLLDRTRLGAVVTVVRARVATEVPVPGVTGTRVKAFALSRDGTRLVAVTARAGRDRLVVARIVRRRDGTVLDVTRAVGVAIGPFRVGEILDLAWRTPTTVALLTAIAPGSSQVVVVPVDGSSSLGSAVANAELFRDDAVHVVTSPAPAAPLYVGTTDGRLFGLGADGRWTGAGLRPGLTAPTYVG